MLHFGETERGLKPATTYSIERSVYQGTTAMAANAAFVALYSGEPLP
jgi:hypothetical protein